MAKVKEKTTGFYFKMSPREWEFLEQRMAQTNISNKSAFIRKMCIDGHVIVFDSEELKEIGRLLRINVNNINQIAKAANSGYGADRTDVAEVQSQLAVIREMFGELLSVLSEVAEAKPGKWFIPPPKITDYIVTDFSEKVKENSITPPEMPTEKSGAELISSATEPNSSEMRTSLNSSATEPKPPIIGEGKGA